MLPKSLFFYFQRLWILNKSMPINDRAAFLLQLPKCSRCDIRIPMLTAQGRCNCLVEMFWSCSTTSRVNNLTSMYKLRTCWCKTRDHWEANCIQHLINYDIYYVLRIALFQIAYEVSGFATVLRSLWKFLCWRRIGYWMGNILCPYPG